MLPKKSLREERQPGAALSSTRARVVRWESVTCARVCEIQPHSGGVGEHLALRARPATPAASAVLAGLAREIGAHGRTIAD